MKIGEWNARGQGAETRHPTMKLRWMEASGKDKLSVPTALVDCFHQYYKLMQWWEDESGNGEWREVEVEP